MTVTRLFHRFLILILAVAAIGAEVRANAAQPVTIDFEDIFNQPMNRDPVCLDFTWRGVKFNGGCLWRTSPFGSRYETSRKNAIVLFFPPGSTDIAFDVDGYGGSIILFEYMNLRVWNGGLGSGTVVATIPLPNPLNQFRPPKQRITIPGPVHDVTIFTAAPPSGIGNYGNVIVVDNVVYTPPDPDPTFTFDIAATSNVRVLIHKFGADSYPSPQQSDDRRIRVEGTVMFNGQPAGGKTIHFRLKDPADTAAYVQNAGDAHQDDNVDGPGNLNGAGKSVSAVSDGAGRITLTLEVTDHVAGDNYQIEASPQASFSCAAACAKSAVYTAWKRIYLEKKRMFRQGAYVTRAIRAEPGGTRISVSDLTQFKTFDVIRLIHAPSRFTPLGPSNGGNDPARTFYTEDHVIRVHTQPVTLPDGKVLPPHLELLPLPTGAPDVLTGYYGEDDSLPGVEAVSDAVGVVGTLGPLVFPLDDALLRPAFENAFVGYVDLPTTVSELPFQPRMRAPHLGHFPAKWAESSVWRGAAGPRTSRDNHQFLASGSRLNWDPPAPNGLPGAELGQTQVETGFSRSWVWSDRITAAVGESYQPMYGQSALGVLKEIIVHEMTHQWKVNLSLTGANLTLGHCSEERYQGDGKYCLMHVPFNDTGHNSEFSDGVVDLHYRKLQGNDRDSEYVTIRRADEPVPTK